MKTILSRTTSVAASLTALTLGAMQALAQTGGQTSDPTSTTTTTTTSWWVSPWAWAVGIGIAVFLVIIIAITNRGGRSSV